MCGQFVVVLLMILRVATVDMDAEQASQVLQRLQVLEQTATEQLIARRGDERALVEVQTRIAQPGSCAPAGWTWQSIWTGG